MMSFFRTIGSAVRSLSPKRHAIWVEKMEREFAKFELPEFKLPEGFAFHPDKKFLDKLTDQFIEFVRVIDEVEFFTVKDIEDSKPWLQMAPSGEDDVYLNIGSNSDYQFDAMPWLENISEFKFTREYEIPREFFADPLRVSYLLSVIYRTYSDVVIEIACEEEHPKEFKTLFPVVEHEDEVAVVDDGIIFNLPEDFKFHENEVFLKKLTDQFLEFVRVIDKVEFFTVSHPKDSKPWLQILPWGEHHVLLNIGSQVEYDFSALPSLINRAEESYRCEYLVPRLLFADLAKARYLLSVIYENYDAIVISEIANDGPALKMKTLFPVETPRPRGASANRSGAAAGVAAATGAAASTQSTKFFVARTEEEQASGEETSSFDWL